MRDHPNLRPPSPWSLFYLPIVCQMFDGTWTMEHRDILIMIGKYSTSFRRTFYRWIYRKESGLLMSVMQLITSGFGSRGTTSIELFSTVLSDRSANE
jgi:hypothetical protein